MSTSTALTVGLVGNPNCGKSALFNALTGAKQKVANYAGVTVERRTGRLVTPTGKSLELIDLPGTYSLTPRSPDEAVTRDVVLGMNEWEAPLDGIICVLDATNLRLHLRFALELKALGRPMCVVLNMMDMAERDKLEIDTEVLERELGLPVIPTVAVRKRGVESLLAQVDRFSKGAASKVQAPKTDLRAIQKEARRIADQAIVSEGIEHQLTRVLDGLFLHPLLGPALLAAILFMMFQAVFSWAAWPMDMIDAGIVALQDFTAATLPDGWLKSLINDGILAGVGSVIIFLPQILILFAFILILESSGYMARAAYLMDRIMLAVGLNGRAFIPLLSSFACAIPGIMAARSISNPRDRLTTILIAPLMTCSARLPVYTLIIAAFIPNTSVGPGFGLQGVVMFGLYIAGITSAVTIAFILRKTLTKGPPQPLLMELPKYQVPILRDILLGLWQRALIFLKRAGKIIFAAMVILWVLLTFPGAPDGATQPDVYYSLAGTIGRWLSTLFAPIGFNWEISIALIPGMAAREVAIAALGTVYALSGSEDAVAESLRVTLQSAWSLPTALSFLAWFIFAPQCLSTLAVTRRETNSWRWPIFMAGYMFAMAYVASLATYQIATALI